MLLQAKGIRKSYRNGVLETSVLKGVTLEIPERARMVITGASGAGKSTLLHILGSLDRPTAGTVFFRGEDIYQLSDRELSLLRNREIGFVFQFHHLLPDLTALENVMAPLRIRGIGEKEARDRAAQGLEKLQLQERLHHRPSQLSGGEQQRVAIARALVGKPSLLLADEPTGNLDRKNGEQLIALLLDLQEKEGMALVLVTHNEELTKNFPVKKVMQDGQMGSP